MEEITFKTLEADEYGLLAPIFYDYKTQLPSFEMSRIAAAMQGDRVVGFLAISLSPMVTMWIDPNYRHIGMWRELVEMIAPLASVSQTYVVASTPESEAMCQKEGLRKIDFPIYVKD